MARTASRSLPSGKISPLHALSFGIATGTAGTALLYFGCNPLTAALGLGNILLYALVYTPMKRVHHANTWVGAVVGAVPPVMGWTGAVGCLDPGAALLGAVLFFWQMPHFFSLAWALRNDYARAGYRMLSVTDPQLTALVSLRHSVGLCAVPLAAAAVSLTTPAFVLTGSAVNAAFTYLAYRFYKDPNNETAKRLFRASLAYLPLLFALLIFHKHPLEEKALEAEAEDKTKEDRDEEVSKDSKENKDHDQEKK